MTQPGRNFNTEHEMDFLDSLGRWTTSGRLGKLGTRMKLLRNYQRSMTMRLKWGDINITQIQRHLVALIEREEILNH